MDKQKAKLLVIICLNLFPPNKTKQNLLIKIFIIIRYITIIIKFVTFVYHQIISILLFIIKNKNK
jgi:hypothetical protein